MFTLTYSLADQSFATTKSVGIFNLSVQLLRMLAQHPTVSGLTVLSNPSLEGLLQLPRKVQIRACDRAIANRLQRVWWDQWGVYTAARKTGTDWLFLPKGFASFVRSCPTHLALYVHDTILESYYGARSGMPRAERYYFGRCLQANLRSGSLIFTNSDFTKGEIQRVAKRRGLRVPPLINVGIGFDQPPSPNGSREEEVLVLASPFPHKRTDLALAYLQRWQRQTGFAGRVRWIGKFPAGISLPQINGWEHAPRMPEKEFRHAMSRAQVLVFFSEYEGFGMPPVEAVLHGACPVYSELPPTLEVMAGAGAPFRNGDYESFCAAMQRALALPPGQLAAWRDTLLDRFNWTRVCNRVVEALEAYSLNSRGG